MHNYLTELIININKTCTSVPEWGANSETETADAKNRFNIILKKIILKSCQ